MFLAQWSRIDHAWHIVGVGFVVSLLTSGIRLATGPFIAPMMAEFGLTHTQVSAVVAFSVLIFGLFMPIAGRVADLFGGRVVVAIGAVLMSSSLAVAATTALLPLFIFCYAVVASIGFACTSHVCLAAVVGRWFVRRRGLAMTFISSGAMAGMAVMVPLSAWLIAHLGWRQTMLVLAGTVLVADLVCAAAVGGHVSDPTASPSGKQVGQGDSSAWRRAVSTRPFWVLSLGFFACGYSMTLLGTHGVSMLEDHGFSTITAASGVGVIGFVSMFGTLMIGAASDWLGRRRFLALIYGVRGLGFLGLLLAGHEWQLYAVAVIGGIVWGGNSALTSAVTADLYGAGSVGTLFGLIFLIHQIGSALGSYLGGWGYDTYGSYTVPYVLAIGALFIAAWSSLRLPDTLGAVAPAEAAVAD